MRNKIINFIMITVIAAASLFAAAVPAFAGIEGGGSGEVVINPKRIETSKLCDISLTVSNTGAGQIYEVQVVVPANWRYTVSSLNLRLEGPGFSFAQVTEVAGGGYQNNEFVIKISGASIGEGRAGQVTLLNLTSPAYVASDSSPLNRFVVRTRLAGGVLASIDASPACETYNPVSEDPVLLINEIAPRNAGTPDYIEVYCKNDGNFGNGFDMRDWQLGQMSASTPDKTFGSMIVKTGNYLTLKYDSSSKDDVFPVLNVLNSYTARTGISDTSFIITLKNSFGQIVDAVVCNNMTDDPDFNSISYLLTLKQWEGLDKKAGVNVNGLAAGHVVARFPGKTDTNTRNDFSVMNYQTPGALNGNLGVTVKLLVNEFKAGSNNGDFIEIYVQDDGSGGGGTDLAGYEISDGVDMRYLFQPGTAARTGDYIVVNYGATAAGIDPAAGRVINVRTTVTGLSKVFGAITVRNSALSLLDAVCYSAGPLSEANRLALKKLVDPGYILDMAPPLVYDDADCVSIKAQPANSSFGRNERSADTNSRTDFSNFAKPTPGRPNVPSGLPIALTTDPAGTIYANANSEVVVTVRAVDVDGLTAQTSSAIVSISSDAEGTLFSEDGLSYYPKLEVTLRYGERKVYVKDTKISVKTITFRDKFDPKLSCKLNFAVTSLFPVQINEIMYYPQATVVKDPLDLQWVELFNRGGTRVDLSSHKLRFGARVFVFPNDTIVEPNSYIVVTSRLKKSTYREDAAFADVYGDADGAWDSKDGFTALAAPGFTFGTSGGRMAFTAPDDVELSVVEFDPSQGGRGTGKSLEKSIQTVYSIGNYDVDRYNFVESGKVNGTPGKQNSRDSQPATKITLVHSPVATAIVNRPVSIYARVEKANEVEVGYRNSRVAGIYTYIRMVRVDNTNVYRSVIPGTDVTLDGVDYYVRVHEDTRYAAYAPENGELSPYKIEVVDNTPRLSLVTPAQLVAPGESFYVDAMIENAPGLSEVSFNLAFDPKYLSVEDSDAVRPGVQLAVGSAFPKYFAEVNEADNTAGSIKFKVVDQSGSASSSGQVARIKFKAASTFGQTYPEYIDLTFSEVSVSGSADASVFSGKVKIGDRASGTVGLSGGIVGGENQARVIVPAGALKADTALTIRKMIKSEIPRTNVIDNMNGIRSLDVAYEFGPSGRAFNKPVTIEIPFTPADLAAYAVADSSKLKIYYYNTATLSYEKIGGIVSAGKVSAKVNHFSLYILVEDLSREEFDLSTVFVSPNPFSPNDNGWNDSTFINYTTTVDTSVTIKIFDVRGVLVRKLLSGEQVSGGRNKAEWDGRDDFGRVVRTGVYVYQLKTVSPAKSSKTYQGTIVVSKNLKD